MGRCKSICFVTTGDIKTIATAKRALGLANPLADLGWKVSIILEDTDENRYRAKLECDERINVFFHHYSSALDEIKKKNIIIRQIHPDYLYICAFVKRNIVGLGYPCKRIVEHSELMSATEGFNQLKKINFSLTEYLSIFYANGLLNASKYLQQHFQKVAFRLFRKNIPMLYFPYAYNINICVNKDQLSIETFRNKLNIKRDEFVFVFLGSVTISFGAYLMVEAIKQVIEKGKYKVRLFILGKGKYFNQLKEYVLKEPVLRNSVSLPGYVAEEDIPFYFSVADSFVLPMNDTIHDWARCPSKLYMYLPYNKPIITCKIGEPYEVLKQSGIYYECGSTDECSKLLQSSTTGIGMKYIENALSSMVAAMERVCDGNYCVKVNPFMHTWNQRAIDLNKWLNEARL